MTEKTAVSPGVVTVRQDSVQDFSVGRFSLITKDSLLEKRLSNVLSVFVYPLVLAKIFGSIKSRSFPPHSCFKKRYPTDPEKHVHGGTLWIFYSVKRTGVLVLNLRKTP